RKTETRAAAPPRSAASSKKLSYMEQREFENMEQRIGEAEASLESKRAALHEAALQGDGRRLTELTREIEEAHKTIDGLYARWAELEGRAG
ncbi:MAG TPA: ABC transporter C-terminal domain-containing protein, partial [Bryobacteraceae bacterium]|nr:ABC transporter C-terminal domain-containing protein [Bryobacteraceae bacterium]